MTDRFWSKVAVEGDCWVWTAAKTRGYGAFSDKRNGLKSIPAHRWAYESMVAPIPEGLTIDHLCRNKSCVNPYHMDPVPRGLNTTRARLGLRLDRCRSGKHEMSGGNVVAHRTTGTRQCRECQKVARRAWLEKRES